MRITVLGWGYWGPNVARALRSEGWKVTAKDLYPERVACASLEGFDDDGQDHDAVAICTPAHTHYELAGEAISNGKHVLVAKPLALTPEHASELVALASEHRVALLTDHTFLHSGAVQELKRQIVDPLYFDSVRVNLGLIQHDTDVIWDLACHDVSIMLHVLGRVPVRVSTHAVTHLGKHPTMAHITYDYGDGLIGHSHVNWLSPVKVRRTIVGCKDTMIVYDDTEPSEKIRVYDRAASIDPRRALVDYRLGGTVAPPLDTTEPLRNLARAFREFCTDRLVDADAVDVVRVLAACSASAGHDGDWMHTA